MALNQISFETYLNILESIVTNPPKNGCTGFFGGPGVAKTQGLQSVCAKMGKSLSLVVSPLVSVGDLMGCAFPDYDTSRTVFLGTELLDEKSVIAFDELNNADKTIHNAACTVLETGWLHKRKFEEARVWMANPTAVSELADTLPRILMNRGDCYILNYTIADLMKFALNEGRERFHPYVLAFLQETGDRYLQVKKFTPTEHDGVEIPELDMPFPSPRSWERLSERLHRRDNGLNIPMSTLAYANVGDTAGKAFTDYTAYSEYVPSVRDVINGKEVNFPEKSKLDGVILGPVQCMTVFSLLSVAASKKEFQVGSDWIVRKTQAGEIGRDLFRTFLQMCPGTAHKPYFAPVVRDLLDKHFPKKEAEAWVREIVKTAASAQAF